MYILMNDPSVCLVMIYLCIYFSDVLWTSFLLWGFIEPPLFLGVLTKRNEMNTIITAPPPLPIRQKLLSGFI